MNQQLWTSGIVESDQGRIAWPEMTRLDAEKLPPSPTVNGPSKTRFRTSGVFIADAPFVAELIVESGPICAVLWLDPQYAREIYQHQFPGAQEMEFYEDLFEQFLGSRAHEHFRPWGIIKIAELPWTNDPIIVLQYRKLFIDHFNAARCWRLICRQIYSKVSALYRRLLK